MCKLLRFIVSALLIVICASQTIGAKPTKIVILVSDDLTSTKRTIRGAKKVILAEHPDIEFSTHIIDIEELENKALLDTVRIESPSLILTIGSAPTQFAKDNFTDIPIVFSSVKYPVLSGFVNSIEYPGRNITGASINIPTQIQFEKFKQIIPNLKKIGVLYTDNTAPLIPQAKVIAANLNLDLVALNVSDDRELPIMLDSLANSVQGIWSVADHNLFKPKSTRYILINTLRKRIPFMGFSKYVVESGALFALDFDYKAVGIQAGSIVNEVLDGKPPEQIAVTTADVIWFHYNEKTAERIKITIPNELAAIAKEVFR